MSRDELGGACQFCQSTLVSALPLPSTWLTLNGEDKHCLGMGTTCFHHLCSWVHSYHHCCFSSLLVQMLDKPVIDEDVTNKNNAYCACFNTACCPTKYEQDNKLNIMGGKGDLQMRRRLVLRSWEEEIKTMSIPQMTPFFC